MARRRRIVDRLGDFEADLDRLASALERGDASLGGAACDVGLTRLELAASSSGKVVAAVERAPSSLRPRLRQRLTAANTRLGQLRKTFAAQCLCKESED